MLFSVAAVESIVNRKLSIAEPYSLQEINAFAVSTKQLNEEWAKDLTAEEIAAVRLYSTFAYGEINRTLRDHDVSEQARNFVGLIRSALDKLLQRRSL